MLPSRRLLIPVLLTSATLAAVAFQQTKPTAEDPATPQFDPRPPRLKRGIPKSGDARGEAPREATVPTSAPPPAAGGQREIITDADGRVIESRTAAPTPAGANTQPGAAPAEQPEKEDPFDKVREVMDTTRETLPNFVCEQITLRSQGEGRPPQWKVRDRVTNEILFVDGKEDYRNIKVKGKLLGKRGAPQDSGTWSSGDWITTQLDVISPASAANFREVSSNSPVAGRKARKYTYAVAKPNSHWKVEFQGYRIFPAYKGAVWIDEETHRVMRVEMQAVKLPSDYPLEVVEMVVENGMVKIGGQDYVLPVQAGALACEPLSGPCTRNEIEFRNYRKFTAESTISTTDSSVTFDGADDQKPAAAPSAPAAKAPAKSTKTKK